VSLDDGGKALLRGVPRGREFPAHGAQRRGNADPVGGEDALRISRDGDAARLGFGGVLGGNGRDEEQDERDQEGSFHDRTLSVPKTGGENGVVRIW